MNHVHVNYVMLENLSDRLNIVQGGFCLGKIYVDKLGHESHVRERIAQEVNGSSGLVMLPVPEGTAKVLYVWYDVNKQ